MKKITIKEMRNKEYQKAREIIVSAFQDYTIHFYTAFASQYGHKKKKPRIDDIVASMISHNGTPITATHINRYIREKYYIFAGDIKSFNDWNAQEFDPWLRADEELPQERKHSSQKIRNNLPKFYKIQLGYRFQANEKNCILENAFHE
ncbi:MAG: hypothetical protein Q8L29_03535 [archaeon]|nr:hypothetical protein [archaeon]